MTTIDKTTTFSIPVIGMLLAIAVAFTTVTVDMQNVKEEIKDLKMTVASLEKAISSNNNLALNIKHNE